MFVLLRRNQHQDRNNLVSPTGISESNRGMAVLHIDYSTDQWGGEMRRRLLLAVSVIAACFFTAIWIVHPQMRGVDREAQEKCQQTCGE